jgi:hypothetical protein
MIHQAAWKPPSRITPMADAEHHPRLIFREPFDELTAWEALSKGWYSGVTVELPDGTRYVVFFYDSVRLAQDLEAECACGHPYLAEPGLIVVPEITEEAMRTAVRGLFEQGWFRHLRPLSETG